LPLDEVGNLYKMHMADKKWGSTRWACIRRKQKPQRPVADAMKSDGSWDSVMEALPDNYGDQVRQACP
jgi:hypothetical protein